MHGPDDGCEALLNVPKPNGESKCTAFTVLRSPTEVIKSKQAYLQHPGEACLLMLGGCAKVHGPGHISCATVKLASRVQQQQGVAVHLVACLWLGSVVNDCTMWSSTCIVQI